MTQTHGVAVHRKTGRRTVDRIDAARLLRTARSTPAHDAEDAVEWAFSVMPHSRCARRLKIEQLLQQRNTESADSLIAQGLLMRPTDAALSLLRARSFYAQNEFDRAHRELRLVLPKRPHHCRTLQLAGQVALRLGDAPQAAHFFGQADRRRPSDRIKGLLVTAWLAATRPDRARHVLQQMHRPAALLAARVLRAEGRLLEAAETLEEARQEREHPEYESILCELIDVLEEAAVGKRLRDLLASIDLKHPSALARAGIAWLGLGAFHTAAVRMAKLAGVPGYGATALSILITAAVMLNRPSLAARALQRLRHADEPADRKAIAQAWCRALVGRILLDQRSARRAGADPHTGRLHHLLRGAAKVFDRELSTGGAALPRAQQVELRQHRSICQTMLQAIESVDHGGAGLTAGDRMAISAATAPPGPIGPSAGRLDWSEGRQAADTLTRIRPAA